MSTAYRPISSRFQMSEDEQVGSTFAWLMTFSDLLMLLIGLFVLRFSMGTVNPQELPTVGNQTQADSAGAKQIPLNSSSPEEEIPQLRSLRERIKVPAELTSGGRALRARLGGEAFAEGNDELSFQGAESLQVLATATKGSGYRIEIASNAGQSLHLTESRFSSPWQLSHARAIAVLRQLLDAGVEPQMISLGSFGASKLPQRASEQGDGVSNLELSGEIDITIRGESPEGSMPE